MIPPLVLWTARLAMLCWLMRWVIQWGWPEGDSRRRSIVLCWSIGCGLYLIHFVSAFALVHHWSHSAAVVHTARQTLAVTGIDWGGGVWFNYLFTLLWPLDVVRMLRERDTHAQGAAVWMARGINAYLAFLVVSATVIFGPSWWWIVFAGAGGMTAGLRWFSRDVASRAVSS